MSEKETRTGLQAIARWEMEALEAWFAGDTPAASENAAQLPGGIRRHVDQRDRSGLPPVFAPDRAYIGVA